MKKLAAKTVKISLTFFLIAIFLGSSTSANAQTLDSVSHIHHLKVVENKVLVLTHEGLYTLVGKNNMKLVGSTTWAKGTLPGKVYLYDR